MRAAVAVGLLALAVAGCSGGGGHHDGAGPSTTTTVRRATEAQVPLTVGECGKVANLRISTAIDPASIDETDCGLAHTVEVAATFEYPAGSSIRFPGADTVDGYATDQCLARFDDYVGIGYEASHLDVVIVAPDERGWRHGDRRIACLLHDADFADLMGSARGSGS